MFCSLLVVLPYLFALSGLSRWLFLKWETTVAKFKKYPCKPQVFSHGHPWELFSIWTIFIVHRDLWKSGPVYPFTRVVLLFSWLHLTVESHTSSHANAFILEGWHVPLMAHSCTPQAHFWHNCLYVWNDLVPREYPHTSGTPQLTHCGRSKSVNKRKQQKSLSFNWTWFAADTNLKHKKVYPLVFKKISELHLIFGMINYYSVTKLIGYSHFWKCWWVRLKTDRPQTFIHINTSNAVS